MANNPSMQTLTLPAAMLQRGFWLYVWRVTPPENCKHKYVYYVGRTGDNSSPNASAPFTRMGQHFARNKKGELAIAAQTSKNLEKHGINPEKCKQFELFAFGPILSEIKNSNDRDKDMKLHKIPRDKMAALEKNWRTRCKKLGIRFSTKLI